MIYNFCITCEHYNDRNRFPEACYGCFNGRNYEVNHYYDMTKEDIENMIKNEEEEDMNNETNYDAELKLDVIESDIIDELLDLTKKNNEMLIDIQKRLDESEGLIWPKHSSEEDDVFDEKQTVEDIIRDQEKEDNYVEDFRSFIESRNRKILANGGDLNKERSCVSYRSCSNCVHANTAFYAEPCKSCNGYSNYGFVGPLYAKRTPEEVEEAIDEINRKLLEAAWTATGNYECDKCKHASKMLYDEPCYSCSIPNDNYKFEPMSNVDKLEKRVCDAFANCANAVKEFNRRFNEAKEKK